MLSNCGVGEDFWSPLDCKEIKPVNSKGNQSWIFIGKTDGEVESPILWPLDAKSQFTGKDPDSRHRYKKQTFGLCKRRWRWDDLREYHWNMYIIICETDLQPRFNARDRVLRAGALGWPWRMGWGGSWEGDSGWGTYVHPWLIHVNLWQKPLQYCKVISLPLK